MNELSPAIIFFHGAGFSTNKVNPNQFQYHANHFSSLSHLYDILIWVDSPSEFRLERGVKRDGNSNRQMWENVWLPAEDRYFKIHEPTEYADIIIDGTGHIGNISKFEVNVISDPNGLTE